jgi:hypothetical protein
MSISTISDAFCNYDTLTTSHWSLEFGEIKDDIRDARSCLGHAWLETTDIYAEVDLERKTQALTLCNALRVGYRSRKRWRDDPSLIAFLRAI